jgi:hypothetical protein
MELTGYASDKDCRSPADNDKDHIKSELLFARQPDLAAAHTTVPFPLNLFYGNSEAKFRNLNFFQKATADISRFARTPAKTRP